MKAAVLHEIGGVPRYEDFPDPVSGDDEVVIDVRAVAVEYVDKRIAAGTHYASQQCTARLPAIPASAIASVLGTAIGMSVNTAAGFVPGETVLVQGATDLRGRRLVLVP